MCGMRCVARPGPDVVADLTKDEVSVGDLKVARTAVVDPTLVCTTATVDLVRSDS